MNKPVSEFKIKCGFFEINAKNFPKLALIIISIGICIMLVFFGIKLVNHSEVENKIQTIEKKIIEGKELSDDNIKFLDGLPDEEQTKVFDRIQTKVRAENEKL